MIEDDVIAQLLQEMEKAAAEQRFQKKELAAKAGLHYNTLRHMRGLNGKRRTENDPPWNPLASTIQALETVLLPGRKAPPGPNPVEGAMRHFRRS